MAKDVWVCGIDAGSFKTLSYVAWLKDFSFLLDLYSPILSKPLPEPPPMVQMVQCYAVDAPQGLPEIGRKRRRCDELAQTPTKVLPRSLEDLEHWKLYKGLIELGIKTFWFIHNSKDMRIFSLDGPLDLPIVAETYPRKVAEVMGLQRLPSKRKEPVRYVDYLWHFLQLLGYRCESIVRPSVDQIDAMLCAIAAQALVTSGDACEALGDQPYVDEKDCVLREGFIVVPSGPRSLG